MLFNDCTTLLAVVISIGNAFAHLGTRKNACGNYGVCKCFNDAADAFVLNCSNQSLDAIPKNVPSNASKLILAYNSVSQIPYNAFQNTSHLRTIDLSHNSLTELRSGVFESTRYLTQLNLSHNSLNQLPTSIFQNKSYISRLNLAHNRLGYICSSLFRDMTSLRDLDLTNSTIRQVPEDTFVKNRVIKSILLSNNRLQHLPENIFGQNPDLIKVELSSNRLTTIPEKIFQHAVKLRFLDISHNNLIQLPLNVFHRNIFLADLYLSYNNLTSIPSGLFVNNSNILNLDLCCNQLTSIHEDAFQNTTGIKLLDISTNNLKCLQEGTFRAMENLRKLTLSSNQLKKLPSHIFECNSKLVTIYLSNNYLKNLPRELFKRNSDLHSIGLSNNSLSYLPRDLFSTNIHIEMIYLSKNYLKELPIGLFEKNLQLKTLDLSLNHLKYLPATFVGNNAKLKSLYLSNNHLEELQEHAFQNNSKLKVLTLSFNLLKHLPREIFKKNTVLNSLTLSGNPLTSLEDGLFYSTKKLQSLRMCSNNLTALPENMLAELSDLGHLSICKNDIHALHDKLFYGLNNLLHLNMFGNGLSSLPKNLFKHVCLDGTVDFSFNEISEIPDKIFSSNQTCDHKLTSLIFNDNKLVILRKDTFKGLKHLTHVFLYGNRISVLEDGVFSGTMVQYVYMFSNNLTEISNKSFGDGSLLELQVYKNNIKDLTAEAFLKTSHKVTIYLQCYYLTRIPLLSKNLTAQCVTGSILPRIRFQSGYSKTVKGNLRQGGFNCSFNKKIVECTPCPSGFYGNRLNGCQACPQGGFYQDDVGRINCSLCSKGTFVNHTEGKSQEECELCPEGTDFTRYAGNRACFCKINYARTHRFQGCSLCLEEGLNCVEDFKSLQPGYYWNWSFPGANITEYSSFVLHLKNDSAKYSDATQQYRYKIPKAHKCPIRLSCENKNSSLAYGIQGRCKFGYRGWLCSKCQKTFYSVLNTCLPCPSKVWIVLEAAFISCLVLGVYLLILWQGKKYDRNKRNGRTTLDKVSSQMKIVLGFYQVVGELFESFHDVTWVGPLAFVGEILSFLKINILRIVIRPHCFSEKLYIDGKLQFIISLCFPVAVFSVLVSCYQVWKLYLKLRKPNVIDRGKKLKELKNKFLTYAILLLFITYPPTCDVIFRLYPGACKTFDIFENDTSVYITLLRSDFDLKCETLKTYQLMAYVATVVYVVSFPSVLLLLLRRYCKNRVTNDPLGEAIQDFEPHLNDTVNENMHLLNKCESDVLPVWIKFLCENYKPQYWYWEIIELARKVTQTVLVTLLGWEDALTKILTIGTSVLFLTLHARLSPMMSNFEQRLQMFSLSAIFINVLIASVPIPHNYQAPLSTILIVINMIIILIIAGEVVFYVIRFARRKFLHVSKNKTVSPRQKNTNEQSISVVARRDPDAPKAISYLIGFTWRYLFGGQDGFSTKVRCQQMFKIDVKENTNDPPSLHFMSSFLMWIL